MSNQIDAVIALLRSALDMLSDLKTTATARVVFCSPVTGRAGTASNPFGGDWFDATGFSKAYNSGGLTAYHTGVDLNRPNYADSGAAVCAAADGLVVYSGVVSGWQGNVIVIRHILEDGALIWTRYAHIDSATNLAGRTVNRGDVIGCIADYNANGPKGDHLHFDVARLDLGAAPGDWPGKDLSRLKSDYIDPGAWLRERMGHGG